MKPVRRVSAASAGMAWVCGVVEVRSKLPTMPGTMAAAGVAHGQPRVWCRSHCSGPSSPPAGDGSGAVLRTC